MKAVLIEELTAVSTPAPAPAAPAPAPVAAEKPKSGGSSKFQEMMARAMQEEAAGAKVGVDE